MAHRPAAAPPLPQALASAARAAAAGLRKASMQLPVPPEIDDGGPTCELPHLDFDNWVAENNQSLPDHPAVFSVGALATAPMLFEAGDGPDLSMRLPNASAFLRQFGQQVVHTEPGYTQAGGHLAYVYHQHSRVGFSNLSLRALANSWEAGSKQQHGQYHSQFSCGASKLCKGVANLLRLPSHLSTRGVFSTNLLVGGPGSGLPFHRHEITWQLQIIGRKVWHLVPPGAMSGELAQTVGPFLYPTSAWSSAVRAMPLGRRPLRCLQHPGQVIYLPGSFWHATENVDSFGVAYGEKPKGLDPTKARPSERLAAILSPFNERESKSEWYEFLPRYKETKAVLAARQGRKQNPEGAAQKEWQAPLTPAHEDAYEAGLPVGLTLKTMRAAAERRGSESSPPNEVLNASAAYAHCVVAGGLRGWLEAANMSALTSRWKASAQALSSRVCGLQCT
jgi:hypothetical protein|eukprot:Transcript_26654.p1 GENE.Transcript_26654~~Transcript_26654.p1  ORF type:complete len:473 (+),score=80.01 Transcript_26654:75-1421(+)